MRDSLTNTCAYLNKKVEACDMRLVSLDVRPLVNKLFVCPNTTYQKKKVPPQILISYK